jgi:hypothetical protein
MKHLRFTIYDLRGCLACVRLPPMMNFFTGQTSSQVLNYPAGA